MPTTVRRWRTGLGRRNERGSLPVLTASAGSRTRAAPRHKPRVRRRAPGPKIEIIVRSPQWRAECEAKKILREAIAEAAAAVSTTTGELAIVLTDDSAIRALNREWRGKDEATNVLSFPAPAASAGGDVVTLLGDIVIAYETTAREAGGREQAVRASSRPPRGAWISSSRRLRSRNRPGGGRDGTIGDDHPGAARRPGPVCFARSPDLTLSKSGDAIAT